MKPDGVKPIESPSGIDLNPDPPAAVRLSKRAAILVVLVVTVGIAMIGYGIVARKQRAVNMVKVDDTKGLTAATEAGKIVANQVPERSLTDQREKAEPTESDAGAKEEELKAPETDTGAQRRPQWNPPPTVYTSQPAPTYKELTPEEKRRALLAQQQVDALAAPTSTRNSSASSGGFSHLTPQSDVSQLTELLRALQGPSGSTAKTTASADVLSRLVPHANSDSDEQGYREQNMHDEKRAFLDKAHSAIGEDYLKSARIAPRSCFEIKAGWDIPAVLEQALNSDLPGEVRALVRENVYDTATGQYLLIPQGARLVGVYDSRVAYGQEGMMVIWNRIIFPDGSSINLEGMTGQDARGQSGFRDRVDNHYGRLFGFAALTSAFSAAFQLSQSRRGTVLGYPSPGEVAGSAAGREISQLGAQMMRRNLNVQPTLKVPIGYRFNVRVNRDLLFESAY